MEDETTVAEIIEAMSILAGQQDVELPLDRLYEVLAEVLLNIQDALSKEDAAVLLEIGAAIYRRHHRGQTH
jgi:hypothetical protein